MLVATEVGVVTADGLDEFQNGNIAEEYLVPFLLGQQQQQG